MALKDTWVDKVNGVDYTSADDVNEIAQAVIELENNGVGDTGEAGEDGGYYTPAVSQKDSNTMSISFTPSKADMPSVEDEDIILPAADLTEADKAQIIAEIMNSIAGSTLGYVDANNNVIITSQLSAGEYTLKYENEDGSLTNIGTLVVGGEENPNITIIWNTYKKCNYDVGSVCVLTDVTSANGATYSTSDKIAVENEYAYTLTVDSITMPSGASLSLRAVYCDSSDVVLSVETLTADSTTVLTIPSNCSYFRLRIYTGVDILDSLDTVFTLTKTEG